MYLITDRFSGPIIDRKYTEEQARQELRSWMEPSDTIIKDEFGNLWIMCYGESSDVYAHKLEDTCETSKE